MYLKTELYELIRADEGIFDFIQDGALDGMWYWDLENPENEWMNAKFWTVLGYNPDEMPHKSNAWQEIINKEDLEAVMENFTKHCKNPNHPYDQIVRYTHKDGSTVWIRCRGFAIRDENGKPIRMLGTHHDITKLKEAEEKHALSERTYKEIFNGIDDSLFILEIGTGDILDVNDSMLKNFGYDRDDISKLIVADLSAPKEPYTNEHIGELIIKASKGETVVFEWLCRRKNGDLFYSENILKHVNIAGVGRIMAIVRDITERKRAEEALRESVENTHYILKHNPNAIAVFDNQMNILIVSDRFLDDYNVKDKNIIGKNHYEVFPEMPEKWKNVHQKALQGEVLSNDDDYFIRPDGSITYTRWECRPWYHSDNRIGGMIAYTEVITERKRAEEKLKTSDRIFKHSLDMLCIAGFDGYFKVLNPAWTKILGWSNEELLSKPWIDFVHPDDRDNTKDIKTVIDEGIEIYQFENRYMCKDGVIKWLSWNSIPYPEENIMFGVARDVTVSKQRELIINNFFELPMNLNLIADFGGKINRVNSGWEIYLGYQKDEIIGNNFFDFIHLDDISTTIEEMRKLEKGISTIHFENRYKHKNGEYRNLLWSAITSLNEHLIYAVAIDITERKRAETQLVVDEQKLKEAQRIAHMGNWELNIVTNELFWSDEIFRIFNCEPQEFKATYEAFLGFVHPDDREMVNSAYLKSLQTKTGYQIEHRVLTKNNQIKFVREKCSTTFNEQGKALISFGIVIDITEQKQAEQELIITKEKAEESDRLKSAFLANMSHEIRTPMNGILGFSDLLRTPNLAGEEQQKYISIIEKSGKRMLSIINDIIDISKIEAGHVKLAMNESNINEMIEYVYSFFKPEAEAKKIKLSYKTPLPLKEATINTDSEKIYAVLTNLVKNAIKYTEKGKIELGYVRKGDLLECYVKDTGIGIPKDRQEAIFKRFIHADIEDKMARQGAGLGLAISKAYVEMLGGEIQVESEQGKGSIFYFTLPCNTDSKNETIDLQLEPSGQNDGIKKLKTLIVEDDDVSEMLLDETVKMFGIEILKARTGVEAVEACRNNPDIDLILMDIQMPEMGGYEATKQIREFNKEVVIIAQTAYGLSGDREKSIDAGCNDYISKPIDKNKLMALMQRHFGK